MKRLLFAVVVFAFAAPSFAEEALTERMQSTEERLQKIEALDAAKTAGFYAGGAEGCGVQLDNARLQTIAMGGDTPDEFAAFAMGWLTGAVQTMMQAPTKEAFCRQIITYKEANGL